MLGNAKLLNLRIVKELVTFTLVLIENAFNYLFTLLKIITLGCKKKHKIGEIEYLNLLSQ